VSGLLSAAFFQLGIALSLSLIAFTCRWAFYRDPISPGAFLDWIGLRRTHLDRTILWLFLSVVLFGALSTILEYKYVPSMRQLLSSDGSPFARILKQGLDPNALVQGLIYCTIQSAGAEEILFRGLIAKRLYKSLGSTCGNIAQAILFWLMHWGIFRLLTGQWLSVLQLIVFVSSFGLGLVLGYANLRSRGKSILPSWLLHCSVNFATFLALASQTQY
jgi:membrane protease YdiL (CAAX protease family)